MKKLLLIVTMFWLFIVAGCSSETDDVVRQGTLDVTWYSIQDVEAHATATSCRSIVRGQVYDFTTRAWQHPWWSGKILAICGKDATPVFEKIHGGKEKPEMKLKDFYIGDIIVNRQ